MPNGQTIYPFYMPRPIGPLEGDRKDGGRLTYKDGKFVKTYKVHEGQEAVLNGEKVYADGKGNWIRYTRDQRTGDINGEKVGEYSQETRYGENSAQASSPKSEIQSKNVRRSPITYRGVEYDVNNPAEMGEYLKVMRANTSGQMSDIRGGQRADEISQQGTLQPAFTPEYQELLDFGNANKQKMKEYFEGKGRADLGEWAAANPALGAKQFLKESGEDLAQDFLMRKMFEQVEGEFSVASDAQVPDFSPESVNLRFDMDRNDLLSKESIESIDFTRNNITPMEVVPLNEQFRY